MDLILLLIGVGVMGIAAFLGITAKAYGEATVSLLMLIILLFVIFLVFRDSGAVLHP